ncbi:ParB/RepB/Spo0J family partition protein [Lysobacter sp. CA199]|uniref:ParB/RepB/Spo0J family partition protein n=1 Tax=Lysobacter sp. CA199 TaxID=3455608 RepID=UPI003F8D8715
MSYEFHPLCLALPDMNKDQFQQLVADVRSNGLLHPIMLLEEQILDGRHRYRACLECEIEPRFVEFNGSDPLSFVISENVARRHLNDSQRAMVAARLANRSVGGDGHCATLHNGVVTQTQAARLLSVSKRSVVKAAQVKEHGTEPLIARVDAGAISVNEAAKIAELNPKAQARLVEIDNRKLRHRELTASLNRSASRTKTPRAEFMETVPGTAFVRDTLNRLDQITNQLLGAEGSAEAFATRFLSEFDWNEPILLQRLAHARRGIEAVAKLEQELERRSKAA